MVTTDMIASLAPAIGRGFARRATGRFLQEGPSGFGTLGIIPLIAAAVTAAGSAAGSYFAADAAAGAATAQAEAAADAAIAPYRYEFKTQKKLIAASRFETAIDAVSGQGITMAKDRSGLLIGIGIVGAVGLGAFLLMKGV